ncbi:MAG: choice-of-anchor J domain-containing protein [Muribaculaceae bacterium]|nr:choice-of-anchor J domain-containing protein [Muribaculaceae bacterium]
MSRSYDSSGAFTPDNWLITPKVYLGGELSYWVFGDYAYPETYRIYVSTTGTDINDFEPLTGDLQSPSVDEWQQESFSLAAYAGQQGYIAFRNYNCYNQDLLLLDAIQVTGPESPWTVIENVTNPVTITNLNPETNYELQVQAAYSDGTSNWTKSAIFTTPNLIAMPEIVSIEPTVNSATITWKGAQDTYNLRYRKSLVHGGFFDDFESGALYGWTNLDEDGDGNKWYLYTPSADATDGYGNPYVFDHTCATSASYNGSALTPDNWLISPKVELKGTFSVWLRNQDPGYAETFAIYLSTTGTDPDDFTTVLVDETQAQSAYTEYTADLSEYNGQKGYIAIRHFNTRDMFRLNVDNFHVQSAPDTPAGEWVVVENVTYPYTIEGLDGDTRYDVEIQGIIDDDNTTEWTEIQWFETERAPMTLAEALAGKPGEVTITSDMKVMVSTTDFSSVTDGEGNWLIVFANDLAEGDVIANAQGIITLGANPMMTINSYDESEAIINVPDKRLDLANIHRESITELKSGEVLTFVGYYNAETGEICAFSPNTEYGGLHIGVSTYYMTGSIVEGKQQAFTAMAWLREAWDESETPNGIAAHAPARVAQDDDQAFENVMAYITAASVPTGIDAVKALDGKEIQGIYNVNGQRVTRPENGVYIIRYTDGTAAKVRF